ncbi:MAG: prepilin peptidase [Candidatus Cloacimonadota bacterium]|nr:MAG: prepilin peptidase [Candidatus Cloacimonadota bacterium]
MTGIETISFFFITLFGLIFGSFFNVCVHRIPEGKSVIFPPSHCPHCKKTIKPYHNIPVLSWIFLGGSCAYCQKKIHWHYILIEILTPLIFILLYLKFHSEFNFLYGKYLIFASIGLIIFFIDMFYRIIPDELSLSLVLIGIIASFSSFNDITLSDSLIGGAVGFSIFYGISYLYFKAKGKVGMGGGDIKYIAAVGTFLGAKGVLFTVFFSSLIALLTVLPFKSLREGKFAFGPFLVTASLLFVFFGNYLINLYLSLFL